MAFDRTSIRRRATAFAAAALVLAVAAPAMAQKAADRVRIAFADPLETTLLYNDQKPETQIPDNAVYDNLLCYDHDARKFVPSLATSWRQVDDLTLEFELRHDVKFHDGHPFTADDVVYTLSWAIDPASKLRFASQANNLGWIKSVEKTGDYTVRIHAKQPTPFALMRFAGFAPIVEASVHRALANKADYGRTSPIGTGPYKVVSFSPSTGIELVRNDDYPQGTPCKPKAAVARVSILPMPDLQTQIAHLMIGDIEIVRGLPRDEVGFVSNNPGIAVTTIPDSVMHLLQIDAAGRSGNKALTVLKVRQAMAMALDRQTISRSVEAGGDAVHAMDALCVPAQIGCTWTQTVPPYDPARAKAVLKDAGYADGFDTTITVIPGAYELADAVAGELRKVGIRASVDRSTFAAFRRKQTMGQIQLYLDGLPIQGDLDASTAPNYMFADTPRNYTHDASLTTWEHDALFTLDPERRKSLYGEINDRNAAMVFVLPICSVPDVVVHAKALAIDTSETPQVFELSRMHWR